MLLCSPALAEVQALPDGYVRLSALAPGIAQDIRYARSFNFTGAPVPGYEAAECILTARTAAALIRVEARLNATGLGLLVFDCYRPVRAVVHFMTWAKDEGEPASGAVFFPGLTRADLFGAGYIARRSSHSLAVTVDAGLRKLGEPVLRPHTATGPCDAAFAQRAPESSVDMGTGFDCFSALSAVTADVGPTAGSNRGLLAAAMRAEGFRGYAAEWWHFRQTGDPAGMAQDFPVR